MKRMTAILLVGNNSGLNPVGCGEGGQGGGNEDGGTVKFSIGASSVGGGFYNGASAISTVVNSNLDGYECTVEVTGASANNALLTQAGEVEMGMCATESYVRGV